ncbi:hypothetical protein PsYK624_099450 [Phanerochaete sordida]|uniref:DUF6533 domain-containing protein n=1 Tax=Phanerochaete sordida TaxID=48140 RepID=A0A9P3GHM2_9APHY|nr:hypothetical protein PsYK624_099450 [Phanerochaete sordida]
MSTCEFISSDEADSAILSSYSNVIMSSLVLYEHLITVAPEVEVVWQRKRSIPSVLFLCNRYNVLCSATILLLMCLRVTKDSAT